MSIDNFKDNFQLIQKGKRWIYQYFVIETENNIELDINIANLGYIFNLNHLNWQLKEPFLFRQYQKEKPQKVKKYESLDQINYLNQYNANDFKSSNYLLLVLKIVDLSQSSTKSNSNKLSEVIDPDIGMAVSYNHICLDFINLLCFYFQTFFSIHSEIFFLNEIIELSIINSEYQSILNSRIENKITHNLTTLCELHVEQFKLIQKSLTKVNQSFNAVKYDIALGLILFLSALENLSQKYGIKGIFDSKIPFFDSLKNIFNKKSHLIVNSDARKELFDEIGNGFMKSTNPQAMLKFKSFCLKFFPLEVKNEKSEELLDDLYFIRSKFLHAGENFEILNRQESFHFNRVEGSRKKLKTIITEEGKRSVRVARIPSYDSLLAIFTGIIQNFIYYLYTHKEDQVDKELYKNTEYDRRGTIIVSIKRKDIPKKPGMVILNTDYYQTVDYLDLYQIQKKLMRVDQLLKEQKIDQTQEIINKILKSPKFSIQYYPFRRAVYIKLDYYYNRKKYDEFLDLFNKFQFKEIIEENFHVFNLKAYCLAEKKQFEEAHKIIDTIITKTIENSAKAYFLDSKADFFSFAEDFQNAIAYYKESLQYENDTTFSFHLKTKKKLEKCLTELNG